MNYQS